MVSIPLAEYNELMKVKDSVRLAFYHEKGEKK